MADTADAAHIAMHEAIRPFLDDLANKIRDRGGRAKHSVSLPLGNERILLSPRDQKLVIAFTQPGGAILSSRLELVTLTIGLEAKILTDVQHLEECTTLEEKRPIIAGLGDNATFGNQLAVDLQGEVSLLTKSGDLAVAKQVAEARRRLITIVGRARDVAMADHSGNKQKAETGEGAAAEGGSPPPAIDVEIDFKPLQKRVPQTHQSRTKPPSEPQPAAEPPLEPESQEPPEPRPAWHRAAALVLCTVFIMLVVIQLRGYFVEATPMSLSQFTNVPGLEEVILRPPEILVVVDQGIWDRSPSEERQAAIAAIGKAVATEGYSRAEVRSYEKPGLATWTKKSGAWLRDN